MPAIIIPFPEERIVRDKDERPLAPPPLTTYRELSGARPKGHPILGRTKRGKAMLALRQVWVELHNDKLWVLTHFRRVRESGYPHDVILTEYNGEWTRELSEAALRGTMKVWDDMRPFLSSIGKKLGSEI